MTGVARSAAMIVDRCFTSATWISTIISKKSVERLVILRLLILPPCLPIVVVRLPRLPGSLAIDVDPAGMGGIRLLAAPGDVEPALGLFGEAFQRVAVDRVDRHALAGRDDADDPIARQRVAAAGKMHRHPRDEAPDRHRRLGRAPLAPR